MILLTITDLQRAVPTTVGIKNFSDVEPYIESAELWLRNNILGPTLYDRIDGDPTENEILTRLCQSVIGNHAYWDAIPFLDLVHTDSGFAVISATNKVPASKERVERLREQCLIRRDNEIESLISWLEEHEDFHSDWEGSAAYSILTDCLIRTASELQQYGQWIGTRKDFLQQRPKLIQETMTKLEHVFSTDYIEELIQKQRDGDATGDDQKVLVLLKYALGSIINGNNEAAVKIMSDALRYIDKHITSFPTYTASDEYKARTAEGYTNTLTSPIFSSIY